MKIAFYDVKDEEEYFFRKNCPFELEQFYYKNSLNQYNLEENLYTEIEFLSTTVMSELSDNTLKHFPNLKFIFTRSMGYDHIDLGYCKNHNIKVFNAPHYGDWTVAEFSFALLLNLSRKISLGIRKIKGGNIDSSNLIGFELHNKNLGVIGLGSIGERVAEIGKGFGMNVFAYDKNFKENFKYLPFEKLLSISDVISINCPLNEKTKHLLNKDAFNLIKRGVVIINTARGEIIETKALINAIEEGKVSYAGLDVLECENVTYNLSDKNFKLDCVNNSCLDKYLLNQKLLSFENVIMTPHMAYLTNEAILRIMEITLKNIECCVKKDYNLCLKNQVLL